MEQQAARLQSELAIIKARSKFKMTVSEFDATKARAFTQMVINDMLIPRLEELSIGLDAINMVRKHCYFFTIVMI